MAFSNVATQLRQRPRVAFAALFVAYALLLGAWGAATPIGQTPDEWAHIFRASSVVQGQILISQPGPIDAHGGDKVRIPQTLARRNADTRCFRFHPSKPVSCAKKASGSQHDVSTVTTASRYPPVYYAAVGWPLLFGARTATIYMMRLMAVILGSLLLASGASAALRLRARFTMTGYAIGVTPMVAYLGAMINPNGLEIAAGASLWANLLLWLDSDEPTDRRAGLIGSAVAAVAMILARTVAIAWVGVAVLSVLVLIRREWFVSQVRTRKAILPIGIVVAAIAAAGAWAVAARETDIAPITSGNFTPTHYTLLHNMHRAYQNLMHWLRQAIANFGWLDTPLKQPMYDLYFTAFFVLVGLAVVGIVRGRWRPGLAAAITCGLAVLLTMYFAARGANTLKLSFWQGRYSIPTAIGVPIMFGYAAGSWPRPTRWLAGLVSAIAVSLVAIVHVDGFVTFYTRNTAGLRHALTLSGSWQPPLGIVTWLVVLVIALLFFVALSALTAVGFAEPVAVPDTVEPVSADAH